MSKKIGIIGAGGMMKYHAAGFRAAGAEVVAVADMNAAAAAAAAAREKIPQHFGSVAELLKVPGLDAVSIIVPNKYHAPLALEALRAGKHVFCEKPPALTASEAQEMADTAKKAGLTLMFNFNNRARPEAYAMKQYIDQGAIGRINSCQTKWIRRAGIPGFGGWFTTKDLSGGGPLIDLLHMIDLGLFFMGYPEPAQVLANTYTDHISDPSFKGPWGIPDNLQGKTDVEAAAHGFVTFKTGQSMSFSTSWAEMNKREEVSVVFQGQKAGGMVQRLFGIDGLDETAQDACELYTLENGRQVNRQVIVPRDESMGRNRSASNFVNVLEGREAPLNTPDQAVALMKIIGAAYESARTGKAVSL
ncbi:Gfo/Idh/MocA family protein [Nibricoccus sp. IMCC34717]|uniref:Gfo/Idh/MocA family protein n=1 Tax=Nibricoccus sp. IMCC34717 TaxID=3034021 RepID=UPI00384D7634